MPITENVPEARREDFIRELVAAYVEAFPADGQGIVHVRMTRLELEAASV